MATTLASNDTDSHEKMVREASEEQDYVLQVGWKALFGFTTRKHLPVLSGALLSAVIAAATLPVFAIIYGLIFREYTDYGAGKIDSSTLLSSVTRYCIILTGIASLNWIANSFYFFFFLTFGELQARSARNRIFDVLIKRDMAWYDTRDTGIAAFLPAVQMHIRDLQLSVSAPFGEGVQCIVQGLAALVVAFYYSWNLTLVIISTVPLIYIVQSFLATRLSIRAHEQAGKLQQALKYITNAIESIETVKCFNGERHELQSFTKIAVRAASLYRGVANLRSIQIGVMQFFTLSVFFQGFWYGSHLVNSGDRDVGQVITTFWAALMAIQGITGFLPQFIVLQKGKMAGSRLQVLMKQISASDQRQELQGQAKPTRCIGDIEFRQVTFSYPTRMDEIAIRDISLFFPAGETTFVIGKSGSGKSTLGQLLVRFYQPSSGQIYLDGVPLNDIDVRWLRENMTLVEQHSILFNDTIRQNIALGQPGKTVSLRETQEAVKFAMLDSIIRDLPEGLETHLGMKGGSLSGGQAQRMALARARVRDAPILILDESTSALDYITRGAILQAIREWRKGKTTIVITHDFSQIQSEDFLYLLDNARLVQEGYRKDLETRPGPFRSLLTSHNEGPTSEETDDEDLSEAEDETGQVITLYDESWNLHSPMRRPLSAVLFGESVLQSFPTAGRETWAKDLLSSSDKIVSRQRYEEEGDGFQRSSIEATSGALKAPPSQPSSAPTGTFQPKGYRSRANSQSSQYVRLSGTFPRDRSIVMQKDYGLRSSSIALSRSESRQAHYPRRLSASNADPVHLGQSGKLSRRQKFFQRVGLSHQQNNTEDSAISTDSLPIMDILKSVWPSIDWRSRLVLFAAIFCAIVHSVATPLFAWVFAQLLTTFYDRRDQKQRALMYSLTILGIAVIDGLADYLLFFLSDSVAQSWALALKTEAMRRILLQPREFFDSEENSVSRLAETLDHFAEEARNLPGRFAGIFLVVILMITISIIWSLATAWKLALVALATGPVIYAITKCYNMISSRWERLSNEADDEVGQVLHETFVNIRTVRCLVLENYFRKKFKAETTKALIVGVKRAFYSGAIFGLNFAGVLFVAILLFWYGAVLVSSDQYTVTDITETFLILMLSINHVAHLSNYMTQVNMSRAAGSRLLRLARLPTTSHELSGTVNVQGAGDISFENVNFTYPTRKDYPVLHDVSFKIPRGSCTAIVGSSGSGKSTIASLLLKLYQTEPRASTTSQPPDMTISNHDIKTLDTSTLRSHMSIVSQTPVLFPGTIAENIAYGLSPSSPLATMDSIRAAAEAAGVAEFIDSLPQGYQTIIGEGGTGLSGGQAQRIAIARALVRDPDILILDEATSALDVASASVVRETILKLVRETKPTRPPLSPIPSSPASPGLRSGGFWDDNDWASGFAHGTVKESTAKVKSRVTRKEMTVIIITHAREMMAIAEHIIMMDKGRVVEEGNFRELKRKKGGAFGRLLRGEKG
ncbi:P-loop containing nucleoside triphosphate hydrolase protein [Cucurbitaria berberidis CBS 394.84]|uniref:P-loop containing nucleoside triphosphate hydrolase protein n=1 Tax=Cucurbitaria berberidis CBS 394.84 TaxID=1168544 RepID=A0A9P4GAV7_9PLEO|nr:P-loop containing nucleoside triphosphate hydrolase protein [Cucurbitaria berberidis CBS 394.84]KAF1841884.1 P-loop containing nucleoside triphosphate hydrolase protein [Cucurbitaria berberidis CBS 394.84]